MRREKVKPPARRPSFPLPAEYVAILEALLAEALQRNAPVNQGLAALARRLNLKGAYHIRLQATYEPTTEPPPEAT